MMHAKILGICAIFHLLSLESAGVCVGELIPHLNSSRAISLSG